MTDSMLLRRLPLAALVVLSGCNLFDTFDDEPQSEREKKAFTPYSGAPQDSVRLGLQWFNGCSILVHGQGVTKGQLALPEYPDTCPSSLQDPGMASPAPQPLLAGTTYFLGQLALTQVERGLHTDPLNPGEALQWMKSQSVFRGLDWTGAGIASDDYNDAEALLPHAFDRKVLFGGAAWMNHRDDSFQLEVVDADGAVVASQSYRRSDFIAENPRGGHTQVGWSLSNLGPPQNILDKSIRPIPPHPGAQPVGPPVARTFVRVALAGSSAVTQTLSLPDSLVGDGVIRVTWSQLPHAPFLFPVRFVPRADVPASCRSKEDPNVPVQCGFGLDPDLKMSAPANGQYYEPGERFEVTVMARDGAGNLLHPPEYLPSYADFLRGESNGLVYASFFALTETGERDTISGISLAGPLQSMRPYYELDGEKWSHLSDFKGEPEPETGGRLELLPNIFSIINLFPGVRESRPPSTFRFTVPEDAAPGTYVFVLKLHRQYFGERFTKAQPFYFQVGQAQRTSFPGRVGNCQLCHRGLKSLENVRHGLPVEFVEGCKTCHNRDDWPATEEAHTTRLFHALHMNSPKFPRAKNDCTLCHLTRESTLRSSYLVCASCHPDLHPSEFGQLSITTTRDPSVSPTTYSECASACHGAGNPPRAHLLPDR